MTIQQTHETKFSRRAVLGGTAIVLGMSAAPIAAVYAGQSNDRGEGILRLINEYEVVSRKWVAHQDAVLAIIREHGINQPVRVKDPFTGKWITDPTKLPPCSVHERDRPEGCTVGDETWNQWVIEQRRLHHERNEALVRSFHQAEAERQAQEKELRLGGYDDVGAVLDAKVGALLDEIENYECRCIEDVMYQMAFYVESDAESFDRTTDLSAFVGSEAQFAKILKSLSRLTGITPVDTVKRLAEPEARLLGY